MRLQNYLPTDTLGRMIEIYRMWRMVRLLKNNQYLWGEDSEVTKSLIRNGDLSEPVAKFISTLVSPDEARVLRAQLLSEYVRASYRHLRTKELSEVKDPRFHQKGNEARSILNGAVEAGFIQLDKRDPLTEKVYITPLGRKFSDIAGFVREEAIFLKPIGVASAVGIVVAILELTPHFISLYTIGHW